MKKVKISFIFNIIIFLLVLFATFFMFTGGLTYKSNELLLEAVGFGILKFFTVDSNILVGVVALIFAYFEYQILKGKRKKVPDKLYILKYVSTVAVLVTCLVTTLYLAPIAPTGYFSMFQKSNLFYHLIIPILCFITFVFFEKTDKIKFKHTFLGVIPVFIYGTLYLIDVLTHIENGKVAFTYDWYGFAQGGLKMTIFIFVFMHVATYILSVVIWLLNRKKEQK